MFLAKENLEERSIAELFKEKKIPCVNFLVDEGFIFSLEIKS
jgi:hypothetical protein